MRILSRRFLTCILFAAWLAAAASRSARGRSISLDGDWNFVADPTGTLKVDELASVPNIRPTRVPSSWQSEFTDLRDYAGVAWYWRSVRVVLPTSDRIVLLRFHAVDYQADVYVNGRKAGTHEGGYLPFEFDVTSLLRKDENQIAVRVVDPGGKVKVVEGIQYAEIPHGKQDWYVETSGLWQSVELDERPRMRLGEVRISAGADGKFKIEVPIVNSVQGGPKGQGYVGAEIRDAADRVLWKEAQGLVLDKAEFSGALRNPNLWSPASPALYTLHAWLSSGDSQTCAFGFRTFETKGGKFYLNGRVIYLRGALDQAFYPDTVYTPPSLPYLKSEMQQAKALGLNLLRCHIKAPDPRYLEAADETGTLIWYEIPNWDRLTDNSKRRAMETLRGMVERDWNHPSIVILSLINESWGVDLKEADQRGWLKQAYHEAKAIVPGWLVDDNSACCDNFHLATDLADFHQYSAIPEHAPDFDRFLADMATHPGWLFSPKGDAAPRGDEPLVLSEFGNWGLPRLPATPPWWFTRDFGGREITRPEGVEERFENHRYSLLFADMKALAEATQWHQYNSLKYEIESLRVHPEIQGYVITEFTDVDWESNGLLDMWRHPKVYAERLSQLQQDDLVVLRSETLNLNAGEKAPIEVYFSHYGADGLAGAHVNWELEGTPLRGSFALPSLPSSSAAKVGKIDFTAPSVSVPSKRVLKARVSSGSKVISESSLDFFIYPVKPPGLVPSVAFHDPGGRLRRLMNEMRARNYLAPSGSEALPVMIASAFDGQVKEMLRNGGRVILLATDRQELAPGLTVVPPAGSDLDGNWISGFLWIRKKHELFKAIGFDTLAGFEIQAAAPSAVIQGIPPQDFGDVLSGIFYGWVRPNVGTLVQARAGEGKLLICTFSLATTYATDPYATYLLDALVNYATSGFTPRLEIPLPSGHRIPVTQH